MEKYIKPIFDENILQRIKKKLNIQDCIVRFLGGFENFAYEFQKNGENFILRVTHSSRRNKNQIKAELDWIKFLSANGISVSNPVQFKDTNLIEKIPAEKSYFFAVIFEKLEGKFVEYHKWNSKLCKKWGQTVSKLHYLSKKYEPPDKKCKRPEWYEEDFMQIKNYIPYSQVKIIKRFHKLIDKLKDLSKDESDYGLIHSDLHPYNFFVKDDGEFSIFDFDSSIYFWYIYDIAKILFNIHNYNHRKKYKIILIKKFFENFLSGYLEYNGIPKLWLSRLPLFIKFREMELYTVIHRSFNLRELPTFERNFMENRKTFIESNVPFIDIDFTKFY